MLIPDPNATYVKKLIEDLSPGQTLQWVKVEPPSWAEELSCIDVVDRLVREQGGCRILGWALWEWPGIMVEGEFHAVWRRPDGSIIDPTPKQTRVEQILFLPDPSAQLTTYQRDNVRKPIRQKRDIVDYILIQERIFRARNQADPNSQYFAITPHFEHLQAEHDRLFLKLVKRVGTPPKN